MLKPYAAICGITQEEMQEQMTAYIERLAVSQEMSKEETLQKLKEKYPNAKLVYVAVHKLGSRETTMQENLRKVELAICEELGVTVSDVYTSGLDTTDANMKNTYTFDNTTSAGVPGTNGSGTHPNFAAIEKYYVPTVSATLRTAQNTTPTEPEGPTVEYTPSIDFAKVADLNDDTQMHGWTYSNGGGTTELVTDAEMGQVLKMSRTSDGGETALIYDGLNITESDTRYVTVTAEMKLDKNGYAHQYSIYLQQQRRGCIQPVHQRQRHQVPVPCERQKHNRCRSADHRHMADRPHGH